MTDNSNELDVGKTYDRVQGKATPTQSIKESEAMGGRITYMKGSQLN